MNVVLPFRTRHGGHEATQSGLESMHPRENGGVLLEPLAQHNLEVVDRHLIWQRFMAGIGHFERYDVTFDDGSHYQEQRAMPVEQQYDLGVTMTTPWWVRIPGYATEVQKELAVNGIASDLVGPQEFELSFNSLVHILSQFDMEHDAAAQLTLFKEAAKDGLFDGESLMATGYSRGGMILWFLLGYENSYGLKIVYFDSNDPCLVEPFSADDIDLSDPDTYLYLFKEVMAGREAIKRHSRHEKRLLLKTLQIGRNALLQHVAVGGSILDGQTGKAMPHIPKDKTGSVRLYKGSLGNQGDKLKQKLAGHQNINVGDRRGLHTSGMSPFVRRAAVGRITIAQTYTKEQIPLEGINLLNITDSQETA